MAFLSQMSVCTFTPPYVSLSSHTLVSASPPTDELENLRVSHSLSNVALFLANEDLVF